MATNSPLQCKVCHENFDEDKRCPRILQCSHHLCTHCINELFRNNSRKCPFCRAAINVSSPKTLMVNHGLLETVPFLSDQMSQSMESLPKEMSAQNSLSMKPSQDVMSYRERVKYVKQEMTLTTKNILTSFENLQAMNENLLKTVKKTEASFHQQCDDIENKVMPKFRNLILRNKSCIDVFTGQQTDLSASMDEIKKKKMLLENLIKRLNEADTFKEASSLLDEAESVNLSASEQAEGIKAKLITTEQAREERTKEIECSENIIIRILRLMKFTEEEDEFSTENREISIDELKEVGPVRLLVQQNKIFAVQIQNGRKRYAKIDIADGNIYLYHLEEIPQPKNAFFIKHEALLSQVDYSSSLAFFDLHSDSILDLPGDSNSYPLRRLVICLTPDTKGARNFSLLCTGEKGPSYANTKLWKECNRDGNLVFVEGGDYEFNNGTGGKPLIPDLQQDLQNAEYIQGLSEGNLWGHATDDYVHYCISCEIERNCFCDSDGCYDCYQNSRGDQRQTCTFGYVEDGLEMIQEAIRRQPQSEITVAHCGIIIPI